MGVAARASSRSGEKEESEYFHSAHATTHVGYSQVAAVIVHNVVGGERDGPGARDGVFIRKQAASGKAGSRVRHCALCDMIRNELISK